MIGVQRARRPGEDWIRRVDCVTEAFDCLLRIVEAGIEMPVIKSQGGDIKVLIRVRNPGAGFIFHTVPHPSEFPA